MAGPIKAIATYWFSSFAGGADGWTENWYVGANSIDDALTAAKTYVNGRRNVLHRSWAIEAVRVSDIAVLGDSREFVYSLASSRGLAGGSQPAEESEVCIYTRLEAGAGRRRLLPLRGIPSNQMDADGTLNFTPDFQTKMEAYKKWWVDNAGTLLVRQRSRDAGSICSIVPLATDPRALQISNWTNAPPPVPGSQIQVANIAQSAAYGYNGRWVVDTVAAGVIATKAKRKKYLLGLATGARLYVLTEAFPAVDTVSPRFGGTRKTGRPFDSRRGRQSATRH